MIDFPKWQHAYADAAAQRKRADAALVLLRTARQWHGHAFDCLAVLVSHSHDGTINMEACDCGWRELAVEIDTFLDARERAAAAEVRVAELESTLRLALSVAPDDPLLITPAEKRVAAAEARADAAEAQNEKFLQLLVRLYQWDVMSAGGDGTYWKREIDLLIAAHPLAAAPSPEEKS